MSKTTTSISPSPAAVSEKPTKAPKSQPGGESTALTILAPDTFDDAEAGAQLTAQYRKAIGGTKEILIFGAMAAQAEEVVATRGSNSRGPQTKGQGLKGWLDKYAPEVNYSNAKRFLHLAEGLRSEFRLGNKVDLVKLLTAPVAELPASDKKTREKIEKFVEGKSQRGLQIAFGYNDGKKKKRETNDPAPKDLTPEEKEAKAIEEAVDCYEHIMRGLDSFLKDNQHTLLDKDQRAFLATALAETKRKVEAVK
ncbi:hypothetical protein BH09VER1_BH09VER1_28650 [soil metagenome]